MSDTSREAQKQAVIDRIRELREALSREPISDTVTKARHQSDRLEQGLALAHPEGIRFAAHTLLKLLDKAHSPSDAVAQARDRLKSALAEGGFPH